MDAENGIMVTFCVTVATEGREHVAVVGNRESLGFWDIQKALMLTKGGRVNDEMHSFEWSQSVRLEPGEVLYRYFICCVGDGAECRIVTRWETNIQPRLLHITDAAREYRFGKEEFGFYDNRKRIDAGWLTGQTEIHLKIHGDAINIGRLQLADDGYSVKCEAVEHLKEETTGGGDGAACSNELHHEVTVTNLNDLYCMRSAQGPYGVTCTPNDYIVYHIQSFHPELLGYKVEIHPANASTEPQDDILAPVGRAYLLPLNMNISHSTITVPVSGVNFSVIGHLTVEYLIVRPLPNYLTDASTSFSNHWDRRHCIQIGHRGLGSSYDDIIASAVENTIASFAAAASHGAEYIEFDVQLSKDKVPVLYHDLHICVNSRKRGGGDGGFIKVPVKDLTYPQLNSMSLHHVNKKGLLGDTDDSQPFPTLRKCFESVDPKLGFNIEVKFSMQMKMGNHEVDQFFDMNEYVDIILTEILQHAPPRKIILSCFHPDICILLRKKQNKYPVMFLTSCANKFWMPYMDVRTRSIDHAISLAKTYQLLGIVVESCVILQDPDLVSKVKTAGLVLFCFGTDNNDRNTMKKLMSLGLDAIIHDQIDELKPGIL